MTPPTGTSTYSRLHGDRGIPPFFGRGDDISVPIIAALLF
jgi:hypothetical protein